MRHFQCVLLDVFTNRLLEGNQLAVFTDARGLTDEEMQSIARETNLSETTFIIPREAATEREHGVKVRIFTVGEELPFAGHPTLGTATVVRGDSGAARVELDLKVGKIPITFEERAGRPSERCGKGILSSARCMTGLKSRRSWAFPPTPSAQTCPFKPFPQAWPLRSFRFNGSRPCKT